MNNKEPTQRTKAGEQIPIPTRGEVLGNLAKTAKPTDRKRSRLRRPKKKR